MNTTKIMLALLTLATLAMPMGSAADVSVSGGCTGSYDYDKETCTGYCEDVPPGESCRGVCDSSCMLLYISASITPENRQTTAMGDCIGIYDSSSGRCTGYETGTCTTIVPQRTIYNPLTGNPMGTYGGQQLCL
jgi:hypothetical protein